MLLLPVFDVLILAGGLLFLEFGRDFRREGAFKPDGWSSEDEDCIAEAESVGRVRN